MMVPDGWYPGYNNAASRQMVNEYVTQYGGTASGVNADVAEAYSVGQVMAQAVTATGGTDNAKIISYLHSGVTLTSVQGPVKFDALGENGAAAAFVFQWQGSNFTRSCRPTAPAPSRSSPSSRPGIAPLESLLVTSSRPSHPAKIAKGDGRDPHLPDISRSIPLKLRQLILVPPEVVGPGVPGWVSCVGQSHGSNRARTQQGHN